MFPLGLDVGSVFLSHSHMGNAFYGHLANSDQPPYELRFLVGLSGKPKGSILEGPLQERGRPYVLLKSFLRAGEITHKEAELELIPSARSRREADSLKGHVKGNRRPLQGKLQRETRPILPGVFFSDPK